MAKIGDIFGNSLGSVTGLLKNLSSAQKIAVGVGIVVMLGGLGSLFFLQDKTRYKHVFVDLEPRDITAVTNFLAKSQYLDFVVDEKGIKVPQEQVNPVRIMLAEEGLPQKGVVGWEKFDADDFTRTEFEQEIQKMRAVQGELARTIGAIDGITSARVHIVVPKHNLFVQEKKKPTAAIYIKTRRGSDLQEKQVKGIQHLVSRSVEGLETNQISIINSEGKLLTDVESEDAAVVQSKELLNYKRQIEKLFEERIRAIVGRVVGPDRVEGKVDAEIDFTQEKQTISDVDPDDVAVVSRNTSGFSMEGQGLNPTGIPGAKSNVPGEQETIAVNGSKAGSKKESVLENFEFSKVVSEKTLSVGNIKRLTVSVIVDGKQIYPIDGSIPEYEARSPEELKKIEDLIKDAVGFREGRDSLTVANLMFQLDPFQMMEIKKQKKEDREYLSTLAISAVVALGIIFFFSFIVRPYFRWLSYDPQKKEQQSFVEEYKPDLELGTMQNVHIQEDVPFDKLTAKEQVMFLARNEPKRTTEAIRIMLSPTHHG